MLPSRGGVAGGGATGGPGEPFEGLPGWARADPFATLLRLVRASSIFSQMAHSRPGAGQMPATGAASPLPMRDARASNDDTQVTGTTLGRLCVSTPAVLTVAASVVTGRGRLCALTTPCHDGIASRTAASATQHPVLLRACIGVSFPGRAVSEESLGFTSRRRDGVPCSWLLTDGVRSLRPPTSAGPPNPALRYSAIPGPMFGAAACGLQRAEPANAMSRRCRESCRAARQACDNFASRSPRPHRREPGFAKQPRT